MKSFLNLILRSNQIFDLKSKLDGKKKHISYKISIKKTSDFRSKLENNEKLLLADRRKANADKFQKNN